MQITQPLTGGCFLNDSARFDAYDVSIAIEEVNCGDWGEQVYKKEIKDNLNLYVKPDYEYR